MSSISLLKLYCITVNDIVYCLSFITERTSLADRFKGSPAGWGAKKKQKNADMLILVCILLKKKKSKLHRSSSHVANTEFAWHHMLKVLLMINVLCCPQHFLVSQVHFPSLLKLKFQCHWGCSTPREGWLKRMDVVVS